VGGAGFGVADFQLAGLDLLRGANVVCVPGAITGTVGTAAPVPGPVPVPVPVPRGVAADAVCRPASEAAAAPVPSPTALPKVRLSIM
jgi:hypothetical protein